jgi:MFS family permease
MQFPAWFPAGSGKRGERGPFGSLLRSETRALRLHLLSAVLGGISTGVILNHEYIAVNGLHASTWQITALTMLWPVSNVLAVFITHWLDSHGRYDRAVLYAGLLLRLPIALMAFSSSVNLMLLLLFPFFASNSILGPAQNAVIKRRYRELHRARLFGWWYSTLTLFSLPMAIFVGVLLDADFQYYRLLFVLEAVFGAGQAVVLSIMARGVGSGLEEKSTGQGPAHFFGSLWRVFRHDREFALFEVYFFLYGVAYLMLLPVIPFFATDRLHLDYKEYAMANGVVGQLGILLLSPFLGLRLSRINPFRFTGMACMVLVFFPLALSLGDRYPEQGSFFFYLAFLIFAFGMAGVSMSWNLSTMHFAPHGQEATYQGLHITLTALRGCIGPVMGSILMHVGGYQEAFLTSSGLFLLAGVLFLARHGKPDPQSSAPGETWGKARQAAAGPP